jgi:hypothetical protein
MVIEAARATYWLRCTWSQLQPFPTKLIRTHAKGTFMRLGSKAVIVVTTSLEAYALVADIRGKCQPPTHEW